MERAREGKYSEELNADGNGLRVGHAENGKKLLRKKEEKDADKGGTGEAEAGTVLTAEWARSGWPAPIFCPATAAAVPISPTDVQVTSEKSCVYRPQRHLRGGTLGKRSDKRKHQDTADVHRDALYAGWSQI